MNIIIIITFFRIFSKNLNAHLHETGVDEAKISLCAKAATFHLRVLTPKVRLEENTVEDRLDHVGGNNGRELVSARS